MRKVDGLEVEEVEYLGAKKKSDYNKITVDEYRYKKDGRILSEEQYKGTIKKSNYCIRVEMITEVEERTTKEGNTRFIKELFMKEYGDPECHKSWIRENAVFAIKNAGKNLDKKPEISIDEWLLLDVTEQKLYKKKPILGDNLNEEISNEEYNALSCEEQKFYLVAENTKETVERVKDTHGHIFVKHDLFNHDPSLLNKNPNNIYSQNGIAEAFAQFAYDNGLSFAPTEEELKKIMHPQNELPF